MIYTFKDMAAQSGQTGSAMTSMSADDIDLAKLYQSLPMLIKLPATAIQTSHEKAVANDESVLKQSGIMLTQAFLTELGVKIGTVQTHYILKVGLIMLGVALIGGVATVLVSLLAAKISSGAARDLRYDAFKKVESFSNAEFDQFSTASS